MKLQKRVHKMIEAMTCGFEMYCGKKYRKHILTLRNTLEKHNVIEYEKMTTKERKEKIVKNILEKWK